uniref:Uncharacterized protein n=1 Tax=Neobodo designis TaxID=312471 RepID=A0A7S1W7C7_NEODS
MVSDRRRKATIEAMLASREFLAAGFRSPELVQRTIVRLPREHRDVLRRFMVALEQCLAAAAPAGTEKGTSGSPRAGNRRAGAGMSPRSPMGSSKEGPSPAFAEYRAAIIGSGPAPPAPDELERFVETDFQRGLAHGEVRPMLTFLARYPAVERFLARNLVGETELFASSSPTNVPQGDAAAAQSPRGSDDDAEAGTGAGALQDDAPQDSTASLAFHGSDTGSDCDGLPPTEVVTVMDAFTQANMLWSQAFPVDLSAVSAHATQVARVRQQKESASNGATSERQAPQSTVAALLCANLALHFPREEWESLVALRDVAADELTAIAADLLRSGAADSMSEDDVVAARGKLALALTNCRDGLTQVSYRATPDELKEALQQRLTHLLADTTSLSHSTGIAEAAATPGAAQQAKSSFFDRIKKSLAKRRDGAGQADEAELERLAHDMHRSQMAAKHYLKCLMNPQTAPNALQPDSEETPDVTSNS